jgi:hypothetical protein
MPVLVLGGEKSSGAGQAEITRFVARNVTKGIIPCSGSLDHGGKPQAATQLIVDFLGR